MLILNLEPVELYDNENNEFFTIESDGEYRFEHSLSAISEWEQIYRIPFLDDSKKTREQMMTYFQCMCLGTIDVRLITAPVIQAISDYIGTVPSATRITNEDQSRNGTYTSSELIYALMVEAGIPFDCNTWNLYRLINLLTIVQQRRSPQKKKTTRQTLQDYRQLNEERRKRLQTKG